MKLDLAVVEWLLYMSRQEVSTDIDIKLFMKTCRLADKGILKKT